MPKPWSQRAQAFVARVLTPQESKEKATNVPASWYQQHSFGALGYSGATEVPFGSGLGFVSSPFSSYYERAWGVLPSPDQARYRIIYRTVPVAHTAVDKLVESALAKSFGIDVSEDNPKRDLIEQTISDFRKAHPELEDEVLKVAGKDLLVHGSCYVEPCYTDTQSETVAPGDEWAASKLPDLDEMEAAGVFSKFERFHTAFTAGLLDDKKVPASLYVNPLVEEDNTTGTVELLSRGEDQDGTPSALVWLKNLDFLTMRIRRDAWGNVFGAVQYLAVPPVAFNTDKIIIGKWNPTSTFYESAYGVSLYQGTIRTQEAIWQIENDLLIIGHALAKPPHAFTRGIVDPASGFVKLQAGDTEWTAFQGRMSNRQAGSDLFLPPWTQQTPLPSPSTSLAPLIGYLTYHVRQRTIALRVPPQLLGVPEGSTRTTATVNQGDYILTVQTLQASLARVIEQIFDSVLKPYAAQLGEDYEVPKVKWNPVMERDESVELGKIMDAWKNKVLTLSETRELIRQRGIFELPDPRSDDGMAAIAELEAASAMMGGQADPAASAPDQAYTQDQSTSAKASTRKTPPKAKGKPGSAPYGTKPEQDRREHDKGLKLDKHTVPKPNYPAKPGEA